MKSVQYAGPTPLLEREYDAWIKEQEFRLAHGIPVENKEWVNRDGTLNVAKLKDSVRQLYAFRDPNSNAIYELVEGPTPVGKNEVKDWKCNKISEKP